MAITVSIVDDHPLLVKGLQGMLGQSPEIRVTGSYHSAAELMEGLKTNVPDVLLLDIQMQELSGEELMPLLQKQYPGLTVVALTNMDHEYYIKSMLQHGVKGYVLKTSSEAVLLEGIRSVHAGESYFDPVIRKTVTRIRQNILAYPSLTSREREVLQYIAQDLTSQEIAEKLFVNKRTIDAHRLHLLQKLGVKTSGSMIKKAIDLGFIK